MATAAAADPAAPAGTATPVRRSGLRHAADRRTLGFAGMHFALVAAACAIGPTYAWLPAIVASSFIQLISVHNAMHSPMFFGKRANRTWQCTLAACIGFPVSIYVPVHNLSHHIGLQTSRDVLRTTEVRHRWNLLNLVHHMWMGTVHLHLLHIAYLVEMRRSRPKWFAQVRWEIVTVLVYFAAIALAFGPATAGLVWLGNFGGQLLMVGFGYVQHDGCDPDRDQHHSRNFTSPIFNWFIMDNGFHTAHHDRPGLHWSLGKAAHGADVVPKMATSLDEPSLVAYLWRAFVWPGRRLRYDGQPVPLPPAREHRQLWTPPSAIAQGASSGAVDG